MRNFFCCFVIFLYTVHAGRAQRIDQTMNSGWKFHKGELTSIPDAATVQAWSQVNLPHTWNDADAFDDQPGYYRGAGWYAKTWNLPAEWKGKQLFLHFEGVNQEAVLYINGKKIGSHKGGYTAFNFDVTDLVWYDKENLVTVKVDNSHNKNVPPLNADFTFYGGIYRNVRLIVSEPVHFDIGNNASDGVFIETPTVSKETARVRITGTAVNKSNTDKRIKIQTVLLDKGGRVVAGKTTALSISTGAQLEFRQDDIEVSHPKLWSPQTPYLYRAVTRITDESGGIVYDELVLPVGMRWVSFNGDKGFMLNGEPFKMIGTNRHQDFKGKGNALADDYHRSDFKKIKELGFNFVRLAHYPQAQEVYRACDELGLLVWSEIPVVNEITQTREFTENCLQMQREHIRQTRNHPSIVLYGYMNEILIRMLSNKELSESARQAIGDSTTALAKKLNELSKKEAPGVSTVMALHGDTGYNKYGVALIPDVIGWNLYFGWYYGNLEGLTTFLNEQHKFYPSRPMIVSEFGADADIRNHSLVPRAWDFSEDYAVIMHASYIKQMMQLKYLSGFAVWNFADFGAENRNNTIPSLNQKGLFTYDRKEKAAANIYRAYFTSQPFIYVSTHNNLKRSGIETINGGGTSVQPVSVFSNLKEVELFLNGKSMGKKEIKDKQVIYNVPFRQGSNILFVTDGKGHTDQATVDFRVIPQKLDEQPLTDVAVNAGSFQYFLEDETDVLWIPDQPYAKGSFGYIGGAPDMKTDRQVKVGIAGNIVGTTSEPVYQTFDEGIQAYRFDVQDGNYLVTLRFAEPDAKMPATDALYSFSNAKGSAGPKDGREFNVSVNGTAVISHLNLARDYGVRHAVAFDIHTKATNRRGIEIRFDAIQGKPVLSGIRIRKTN